MFRHILLLPLLVHVIWSAAIPLPQSSPHLGDIASHIVIVTPQAQVHLEPALKYESPATFIQHLSPVARFASPNEETIVYYPASAVGAARAAATDGAAAAVPGTKQYEMVITQIQQAIQSGAAMYGPQLSEAAAAAAAAAASTGANLFPALFPGSLVAAAKPAENAEKPLLADLTPASTQPLISEGRRFYAVQTPQFIEFVHSPSLSPLYVQTIRARSLEQPELLAKPELALPAEAAAKPDALPAEAPQQLLEDPTVQKIDALLQRKYVGRILEQEKLEDAAKEDIKPDAIDTDTGLADTAAEFAAPIATQPLLRSVAAVAAPAAVEVPAVVAEPVVQQPVAVVADELPQSKVA